MPRTDMFSRYNSTLATARRANLGGVYDIHTNLMQYPQIMQPTHARWEQLPPSTKAPSSSPQSSANHDHADKGDAEGESLEIDGQADESKDDTFFPPVDPVISRNYMVADMYYEGPPKPDMPYPGPDGDMYDIGPKGLCSIADDIIAELPEECKKSFYEAREVERQWKARWGSEHEDGARAHLPISYNSY